MSACLIMPQKILWAQEIPSAGQIMILEQLSVIHLDFSVRGLLQPFDVYEFLDCVEFRIARYESPIQNLSCNQGKSVCTGKGVICLEMGCGKDCLLILAISYNTAIERSKIDIPAASLLGFVKILVPSPSAKTMSLRGRSSRSNPQPGRKTR